MALSPSQGRASTEEDNRGPSGSGDPPVDLRVNTVQAALGSCGSNRQRPASFVPAHSIPERSVNKAGKKRPMADGVAQGAEARTGGGADDGAGEGFALLEADGMGEGIALPETDRAGKGVVFSEAVGRVDENERMKEDGEAGESMEAQSGADFDGDRAMDERAAEELKYSPPRAISSTANTSIAVIAANTTVKPYHFRRRRGIRRSHNIRSPWDGIGFLQCPTAPDQTTPRTINRNGEIDSRGKNAMLQ